MATAKRSDSELHRKGTNGPRAPVGRRLTAEEQVVLRYRLELERFVDDDLAGSREAFLMAYNAIIALVTKERGPLEVARRWHAWTMGAKGPESPELKMLGLAHQVRLAADLWQQRHLVDEKKKSLWPAAEHTPEDFHRALVEYVRVNCPDDSPDIPSVDEIRDWLTRCGPNGTGPGHRLTTEKIVARIMVRCRLFGACPPDDPRDTASAERTQRDRVRNALRGHPHW
jgi:hypothetical protein